MEDGQSWMMTTVKLEEEEEKEQILWREVKLSMSETDSDDDDDEGCRRKAVLEELRHPDHVWDGMFAPKMEKSGEEETEEFSDVCSVKEEAKVSYKNKIEGYLTDNNPPQMWRGIQALTNYKGNPPPTSSSRSSTLTEELNSFFARFETTTTHLQSLPPPGSSTPPLSLQEHEVRKNLRAVNPRKAAGPDGIPGAVIKACADQLTGILTTLFNLSLTHATVPTCLKASTIVPIPKKPAIDSLNDYRPIALTSVIMKCMERSVSQHIRDCLPPTFDPHQFAYRANRSTEDAIAITLHTALSHLENKKSYVRMLFVDYSSAFNTIIPDILITKLLKLQIPLPTCNWIKNFLTSRPQSVRLGPHHSSTITLSTGS
ncbi:uncharacterized protein LOC114468574 [Gouania willdenowi]|uniref:uncharacterized protein LOC114468574 n=1 Tax=Gouania willdenowi TaxID=441366 RepID=UPI001054F438|nr:uncharacterized protein LOC114468574 [Gouania willdenowi]